jgi:signal peptidase I
MRASTPFQLFLLILGTSLISLGMRQYGMGMVIVQGTSMTPNLRPGGEYVMRAGVRDFQRGDVVVVIDGLGGQAVKRIIGLPGETVGIQRGWVEINHRKLSEPYLKAGTKTYPLTRLTQFRLDHGQYFVMGDNRRASKDSRYYGPVGASQLRGRVLVANPQD